MVYGEIQCNQISESNEETPCIICQVKYNEAIDLTAYGCRHICSGDSVHDVSPFRLSPRICCSVPAIPLSASRKQPTDQSNLSSLANFTHPLLNYFDD
ncbi:hypothetical protein KQX54_008246 [Cotesia glomerata]|uniref:Uncharacterized protein n=1 Tax=Cotesia glomerata TaxID=32391 RepID=A0AAV7J5R1_COTGL|nr:hypothetical protein KQX54_008246 [Cotesia glomerata]